MELNRKPLYRQVADLLRKEIGAGMSAGDRLESEEKLGKRLQVSVITIREALWILAGEGLVDRQHGRGTFICEPPKPLERHIGVLIERDISHPRLSQFFLSVTQQVRTLLEERGHRVQIYIGRLSPGEVSETLTCHGFLEDLKAEKLAGVVAVYALPHDSWTEPLEKRKIPLVGIGIRHRNMIDTDYDSMVEDGIRHLVENGRKKIACLGWNRDRADPGGEADGGEPYERALLRAFEKWGIEGNVKWLRNDLHPSQAGAGWEEFREIWFASEEKPDGLFIMDEYLFRDAIPAILDLGIRVPEDLMVVTQVNKGSQIVCPFPVVALEVDPGQTAFQLAEMLHALLSEGTLAGQRVYYPYEVKIVEGAESDRELSRAKIPSTRTL